MRCALVFLTLLLSFKSSIVIANQWSEAELSILRSLSLKRLPALPKSPSNQYADDSRAQQLGKQLFFDKNLSANQQLSCASCHQPDNFFTDGLVRGVGVNATGRNTPTVVGSAWQRWFYWDGRRDSLWSQALIPFEAPDEMGSTRLAVVRYIAQDQTYAQHYEALFGSIDPVILDKSLPQHAGPLGDQSSKNNWYRLPLRTQKAINVMYVNLGKAIAAYERTLVYQPTRFDAYVEQIFNKESGEPLLSEQEIAGLKLFIDAEKTQCLQCHNGATFSNGGFHNIGTGNFSGDTLDFGRFLGLQAVLMDEFNCVGEYSDAEASQCSAIRFLNKSHHIPLHGAYKTPSLRNVSQTAPYFHDGRFSSLMEVVNYYNNPPVDNGQHELLPLNLTQREVSDLSMFLKSLTEQ